MEIHYKVIGLLLMTLALVHLIFPKYFNWKEELKSLSLINRQMMAIHTFFIALVVFLMGLLCFSSATDLIQTKLGRVISFGMGLFWTIRLFIQFFGYSKELWKGRTFETTVHILFSLFWVYICLVFFLAATH